MVSESSEVQRGKGIWLGNQKLRFWQLWSDMYGSSCASLSRPGFANTYPESVCVLCWSVSAGCPLAARCSMNPRSALDCPFWQFSLAAPCCPPLRVPALAFLLHSAFCPTVDEDIAARCLSSPWRWSAPMDILESEDTQMVDGLMLYTQSQRGTCWSSSCCRPVVPSGNLPSPCLAKSRSSSGDQWKRTDAKCASRLAAEA